MPKYKPLYSLYKGLKESKYDVPDSYVSFQKTLTQAGDAGAKSRRGLYQSLKESNYDVPDTYEGFYKNLFVPVNSTTSRALKIGENPNTPAVNRYHQKLFDSVDPNKSRASELTHRAVSQAKRGMNNVRKPVRGAVVNKQGKKVSEFDITPAKTLDDLNREYAQEVTSDWEKEQQRQSLYNTTRSLDEVQRKIAERDAQLDEADNGFWTGIRHAAQGMNVTGGMFQQYDDDIRKELIDPKYKQYLVEANYLTQMKKQLIQEEEDTAAPNATKWDRFKHASSSFTSGMLDEAFGSDAFDFGGYNKMRESDVLLRINDRINRGVATDDDRRLLQILKDKEEVESRLDNDAYSFGRGASQSAGFVTDFLITGGGDFGGLGRLGGKMALGLARKTFAKTMTKDLGKRFAAWSLKNLGKTLGEATGAAMTATSVQVGKTAANATQRYLGLDSDDGGLEYDKDGNLKFKGGTDVGTAIAKAIASGTIENYTELLGPHITSMGKRLFGWAGVGLEKITPDALSKFFDKVGSSELFKRIGTFTDEIANSKVLNAGKKALAKVGVNDMPEEGLEEEAGIILNSLITGDNKFSDLWDKETQYKTWGGVMSMMGAMRAIPIAHSAVGTAYSASKNKVEYFKCKHDLTKAETLARQALGDKWTPIKELIDNADNKHIIEAGINIIRQSDKYSQEQAKAAQNYIGQLLKMRGFNNATMASIRDNNAKGEGQTDADKEDIEVSNAYAEGHEAEGELRHLIQLEYEKRTANLAKRLGLTPEKIDAMNVDSFSSYIGLNSDADFDIFQYKKAKAAYDGVMDNAQNLVDIAGEVAAQRVDNMTNVHDGTIRKAYKKGTDMNPDSPVYIISGNIKLNDDGSINYTDSDKMLVVYDEETGQREAIGNFMLASVDPNMQNAEEVKAQAIQSAKQKIITEQSNVIDGILAEGSEFTMESNDGSSHNYKIVQVDEQGNCIVSVDGTVLPEPLSLDAIQRQYDQSNVARSVNNDQTAQESEQTTQEPEQIQQESQPIEDKFDYDKITNENDGKVKRVDVTDEEGKNRFPNAKAVFLIQDKGAMPKFVVMDEEGNLTSYVGKRGDKIHLKGEMTIDEYKKQRQEEVQLIAAENTDSSMIEDNSGTIEAGDNEEGKLLNRNDDGAQTEQNQPSASVTTSQEDAAGSSESKDTNISANGNENNESLTFEDGTPIPVDESGETDLSQTDAAHAAEWYDTNLGEDADDWLDGEIKKAKKVLEQAKNKKLTGTKPSELVASKKEKEAAIADAQAHYDSAISIRDSLKERRIAKEENTAEGRKELIEKARRKFARLKSSVNNDAEAVSQLYRDTVGSLLHRLYDSTGVDVFDDTTNTVDEYVAANVAPYSLNYEGNENSKGVQQETGLSRSDFAKLGWLAKDGKGTTIDAMVHHLWDNRPSNLENADTQEIRNALLSLITSGQTAFESRNYIQNQRIDQAEKALEEQQRQEENAAYAEQQRTENTNEKINENINEQEDAPEVAEQTKFPDKLKEGSKAIEVPEDATDEKPLGEQRTDSPFSARKNGKQQTEAERAADVEKNKVDDVGLVDAVIGEKIRKSFERIAKMMGAKIQYQRTDKLGNGWIQETKDPDGNVHRTIFITLDSSITEGAQFIFGHEMTHQIKNLNPAAYNELTQLVLDTYGSDAFDKAVDKTMQRYSDAGFSGRARDYYAEEVVADAVGEKIRDLNLAHTLAMKMSHPLLAAIHEILQKIKLAFFGTEYSDVTKNIIRSIEQAYVKTANGQVTNSETGEDVSFSLRQKPEPKKKGIGYKVFVLKDGKLYPPMVANPNGAATPVGVWLDADAAPIAGESKTGRPQVKQGGKGTQGGSGKLAYRPGWHLGVVPYAIQFNRKDAEGNKTLFPKNFVFAEVEYAADVDYQEEARQEGINPSGKYQHSLAGLKHLPTDGYYMYRTNPNPETDPWVITGAMKVNRILTRAEQADLVSKAGREPQQIQDGDIVTDDVVNSINQEIADAPKFSLKVYHGSGADFTEFDFDHMGEGAGSQAFGWGGYVTSSKKIGKDYARLGKETGGDYQYMGDTKLTSEQARVLAVFVGLPAYKEYSSMKEGVGAYIKSLRTLEQKGGFMAKHAGERIKVLESVLPKLDKVSRYDFAHKSRNLYEVDIPDDNGRNYLKWYETLSEEQINTIRDALAKKGVDVSSWENRGFKLDLPFKDVYAAVLPMMMRCEPKEVSKFLSSIGYTGIKYPAGTIMGGAEEDDTNYVIFKPEDMKITEHTKFSLRLKSAIEETETNPSDAQKESGNYKKGHIKFGGYDYTIENPKGSTRSGKDANGKEWKVIMHDTYGYIRGKFGKDGDHLDMFINDKADLDNWNGDVFVVDQVNPDGSFDEHKVMYGYDSMDDAKKAYLANYSDGWQGLGNITGASKDEFDKWLDTSNRKLKPFADYANVKFSLKDNQGNPLNQDGTLKLDKIKSVDELTDEDFLHPTRNVELPSLPNKIADAIGTEGKPVVIKKNIFERNYMRHKDVTPELSKVIFKSALYNPDLYGQNQKKTRPYNWVLINTKDEKGNNRTVLLEVNPNKDNVEIVHWHFVNDKNLGLIKKQAIREGDQVLILPSEQSEEVGGLSNLTDDLSAAKIDNSSETAKENGEKFSLKDEKTMFGMHNISLDKLRKAIKQGGFAAPSMGVIDSKNGIYSGYGEITLIPKAEKIAKRTGKNIGTYAADAWTPIYPPVEKKFGGNGGDVAYDDIESVPKEMQRLTRNAINSFMDGREANGLAYLYLQEKGKAPELVHVEGKYPKELHDEVKGILGKLNGIYNTTDEQKEKLLDLFIREVYDGNKEEFDNDIKKFIKKDEEFIKKRPNSNIAKDKQLDVDWMKEHGYDYGALSRFVNGILRDAETSGKVDENATMKAAQQYIQDKGMKEDFDSWKEKLNDRYNVEEVIFAGYKPDGNRKYLPNTVENAVKVMKQDGKNASVGSASFSHFVASILKPMGTLDQIRKKKGNLTGNYEDVEKFQEKWQPVYDELADNMQPDAEPFESYGMDRLEEVATQKNPKKYAKEEYGVDLTDEDINKLNELIEAVKNDKPSIYFETKFMRPYGLDEFEKAIVPNDTPSDVVDALKMAGIDVSSYERGNAEDRQKVTMDAINSSDNIRFSLKQTNDKFNSDLKSYVENGVLPENSRFELGFPSDILLSAGFPKLPISMRVSLLNKKAGMERHPFSPTDLYNLVDAIQEPLAIFEYTKPNMRNLIVDLTKGEKHFLVGVTLDYRKGDLAVNSISGLFPKENHEWIKWIQDGKAIRIDKKDKVLSLIDSLRTNPEEAERIGLNLDFATKIIKYFENPSVSSENTLSDTKFSLRGSTPYDKQMEEWMEKNHLEKGAVPMEKPIMKEGENIFDYANRMVEWTRNQNLWKTAPKQTGFQDALDKWKADNGLSPDAYPPVRPHRENYSTEIGYAEDLEEYNKKKELWKSAPKPKDFDLSVDLEDMNKQLRNIRRAVLNQKNYDQRTVKAVSDLVRKMLNIGWGDGLSRGKVGNLLSAAKNATGANDVKKYLDKVMGILAENYLNRLSTAYDNLINTKGARADQSGVIKMGSLDAKGQDFMSEYKKAINMDDSSLNTYIANIEEDSAKNENNVEMNDYRLAGIQAAIMYKQQIGGNDADISELKRQIGELKNKKDATKEDKDLLKSLEKKLFENKFDRITMFENLLNNIQRMVKESKGRAKEFREEIAEHKNEILHRANLDLEGVDSTYYDTTTAKKKFVNNDLQRAVFSSTYTFEQFLKFFGKHSANGEGRLYNYFHKLNQDALDDEQLYNEMNRNALDEKTKELFGKNKFMKLVGIDGKGMKEMDVDVTDYSNKKTGKRTIHLKQGQMLYIYLVNKETDGEMKLRAMGITEEDVAAIEENLDPRVKAMGEWLQDEYLPECQRRYQATHTKYFGAPMKEVENYFPLAINNRARNVKEDVNQDSDAMSQLAGTSTGAIVTRRVNVIPLDIENADAFEVAFNHLQEMEEWSAMLPFRQDINTLLSYTHFRNQVQNMSSVAYGSGKTLWDEFKQTAQIAAGTYKPKVNAGMMDSRIAAAMGGIAVAKISGRLWTAIKQSQSATAFLPECDFTRFVKNGVNPYGSWKWAKENIPDFRKRIENITYGDVKLRQYLDELEKYHDWTKVISKWGMAPNILVDGVTCAVGARSVYETEVNRLTKLGYPKEKAEEKAYYKAVAAYNKTQQSSGGMYLSPMQVDRTYVSAALSLFKNANFAYGRMQIEACRGLARTYDFWGGKHKTTLIESMTRQIMEEDGLDENTARAIAKATYNRTFRQNIGRLINFATLVPVSWALYKVLPYLLTGDDDDKKKDMIEEAVLKGFATSLSDNYVIPFASNILNAGLKVEDGKPTFDPEVFRYQNLYINPATSDLANIYSMVGNQKWYSVANKLGMLGVQSLIGFNPETVGALYQALSEADYDNGNTAKEWQIGILKAISAPEESIRELYMDELGLKSEDIKKIPLAELEKRYAERQINRDNLLSQVFMDAEDFNGYVDKYQKSFEKKIKDKMDKWDEYDKKKTDEFFDTTSDPKLKDMIEKKRAKDANAAADEQISKEGLNQEKKGKEPREEAYDAVKMSIDVAEDNAISTYNKVLNKRYAALNDEYNNQTDAMKYIFMSKHPNFKAYKELESEYTNYGKKIKELKEKLVSADGYDAKQTILKQIRAEREKFSELQSKVR